MRFQAKTGAVLIVAFTAGAAGAGEPPLELVPEWNGPCERREVIDVNRGHSPESFVRAAACQVSGAEPDPSVVSNWAQRLRADPRLRRIDVVRTLCREAGREDGRLEYSDPWKSQPPLLPTVGRKTVNRDVGAVFMFFFNCPGGVNGHMDWANTHAPGMDRPAPILGFGEKPDGCYDPSSNPGFWLRELTDAKYAGLDFLLLNVYGPDLSEPRFDRLLEALAAMEDPIKLALFDDTWTWGEPWFAESWSGRPDFSNPEEAARKLYEAKWGPFFRKLPARHLYRFRGRPLIYFYWGGKLGPLDRSAAVLRRMKELFAGEFGVEPFVAVDSSYFRDPAMEQVADAEFTWYTFGLSEKRSRSTLHGVTLDHAMVRWDSVGRDHWGAIATEQDHLVKGPELLERVLADSRDADLLVIATWNDLGEGTGINRNYDYYYLGQWLAPDHFMRMIRAAQGLAAAR
jgi:hypothetical protein